MKQYRIEIFEEVTNGNGGKYFWGVERKIKPRERHIFSVVLDSQDMNLGDVLITIVGGVGCRYKEVRNEMDPSKS